MAGVWTNIIGGESVPESGVPIASRPRDIGTSFKPGDVELIHPRFVIRISFFHFFNLILLPIIFGI